VPEGPRRKPAGMSFTSWIDQQVHDAAERGAFDDLPGAGKPLPRRREADDGMTWLREYLRREGVSPEEMLPTPLRLRKEIERLAETVGDLPSEQAVRDEAAALNRQIAEWRRIPEGPPVYVRLVDADALAARWREAQPPPAANRSAGTGGAAAGAASARPGRRWWPFRRRAGGEGTTP
jgi:hypothetical protein